MTGPLQGFRIIELAGIGPGPFAGMMLADMGAEVLRVDRAESVREDGPGTGARHPGPGPALDRGRPQASRRRDAVLRLVEQADALIEGFRPGVTERLGLGPDDCLARNPRLVYGRMTGWGQEGPYSAMAGHDINYIALSGTLSLIGRANQAPVPPLNLIGDFGGGGMLLAFGVVCGLLEASRSGQGQVIDAAMVDGAALLAAMMYGMLGTAARGGSGVPTSSTPAPGTTRSTRRPTAATSRSVRSSRSFSRRCCGSPGWPPTSTAGARCRTRPTASTWPAMKERLAAVVKTRTRAEWCELLEGSDACFAPVLDPERGRRPPPQPPAGHLHRGGRGGAARAGAPLQPDPTGDRRSGGPARPAHRRGVGELGFRRRRGGEARAAAGARVR